MHNDASSDTPLEPDGMSVLDLLALHKPKHTPWPFLKCPEQSQMDAIDKLSFDEVKALLDLPDTTISDGSQQLGESTSGCRTDP